MSGFDDSIGSDPHFHGHRERLKNRFRDAGKDSLADYELLELILFQILPRRDTKPIAKALLSKFGSFTEVLAAPEARLTEVAGGGEAVALYLKIVENYSLAELERLTGVPVSTAALRVQEGLVLLNRCFHGGFP